MPRYKLWTGVMVAWAAAISAFVVWQANVLSAIGPGIVLLGFAVVYYRGSRPKRHAMPASPT